MRRIVLIDGENFLYGLRTLSGSSDKFAPRDSFSQFPFRALIEEVVGDSKDEPMLYYGARLRKYDKDLILLEKTTKAIKFQLKLVNSLRKQKIEFIKAGYLRARESDACRGCGKQDWKLLEKGVDVGLAVRMVAEAAKGVQIVLVSSDTDLLPAVQAARNKGANIMFIGFEYQVIHALIRESNLTRTITAPMVRKYLKKRRGI